MTARSPESLRDRAEDFCPLVTLTDINVGTPAKPQMRYAVRGYHKRRLN